MKPWHEEASAANATQSDDGKSYITVDDGQYLHLGWQWLKLKMLILLQRLC